MAAGISTLMVGAVMALGQVPLSMPPQPEDARLMQAAPDDCVLFFSSAGMAAPDIDSPNRTEQFLAEPEVQAFTEHVGRLLTAIADDRIKPLTTELEQESRLVGSLGRHGLSIGRPFLEQMITEPWIAYADTSSMQAPPSPTDFRGAIIIRSDSPEATQEYVAFLAKLIEADLDDMFPGRDEEARGIRQRAWNNGAGVIYSIDSDGQVIEIGLAMQGPFVAITIGEGELDAVFDRMETPVPAWLQELNASSDIERKSTLLYLSAEKLIDAIEEADLLDLLDEKTRELLAIDAFKSLTWTTGLDETGYVSRVQVDMDGGLQGIWKAVLTGKIEPDDLSVVPNDSLMTLAVALPEDWITFDENGNVSLFGHAINEENEPFEMPSEDELETMDQWQRDWIESQREEAEQRAASQEFMDKLAAQFGTELVESLGEKWIVYLSQSENGLIPYNVTLANRLDDAEQFDRACKKLMLGIAGQRLMGETELTFDVNEVAGVKVHTVNDADSDIPVGLSWMVVDDVLYASINTVALKSIIYRDESFASLATDPELVRLLEGEATTAALCRTDPLLLFDLLYGLLPYANGFIEDMIEEAADEEEMTATREVGFPATIWPAATVVRKYVTPNVCSVQATENGFQLQSQRTIPFDPVGLYIGYTAFGLGMVGIPMQIQPAYTDKPEDVLYYPPGLPTTVPAEGSEVPAYQAYPIEGEETEDADPRDDYDGYGKSSYGGSNYDSEPNSGYSSYGQPYGSTPDSSDLGISREYRSMPCAAFIAPKGWECAQDQGSMLVALEEPPFDWPYADLYWAVRLNEEREVEDFVFVSVRTAFVPASRSLELIRVAPSEEELLLAKQHEGVVKVFYRTEDSTVESVLSTDLEEGADPIEEADKLGTLLAIMRIGTKKPKPERECRPSQPMTLAPQAAVPQSGPGQPVLAPPTTSPPMEPVQAKFPGASPMAVPNARPNEYGVPHPTRPRVFVRQPAGDE